LHEDVASAVKKLLTEGEVDFALESFSVIAIMADVATLAPEMTFALQGVGEEPRTVWVREYEDGQETFSFGPPEGGNF
jgi:hypothetical protein